MSGQRNVGSGIVLPTAEQQLVDVLTACLRSRRQNREDLGSALRKMVASQLPKTSPSIGSRQRVASTAPPDAVEAALAQVARDLRATKVLETVHRFDDTLRLIDEREAQAREQLANLVLVRRQLLAQAEVASTLPLRPMPDVTLLAEVRAAANSVPGWVVLLIAVLAFFGYAQSTARQASVLSVAGIIVTSVVGSATLFNIARTTRRDRRIDKKPIA